MSPPPITKEASDGINIRRHTILIKGKVGRNYCISMD